MDLVGWLMTPLFSVGGQAVSLVEAFGFVTGALCVWAVTRQWTWNWPVGIANNLAFLVLFLGSGLYADAALQVAFAAVGVYGWIAWTRGAGGRPAVAVRRARPAELAVAVALVAAGTVVVALVLAAETDSVVPWPDAFILAASLVATWGQARKVIEQWWMWILVDVVSIPLYVVKGLWPTALLYVGFLALCVVGLAAWTRELRAGRPAVPRREEVAA